MSLKFTTSDQCHWWPLHQDGSCGDQLLAGKSLRELQEENATGTSEAAQLENAWITVDDWEKLIAAGEGHALVDAKGEKLAWLGDGNGGVVHASEASFILHYSWEFLNLNEQLVSKLTENNLIGEVNPAAHIDGIVHLGKGSRILPGVVIEGNVVIGENCKVGPNCYLRGSTTIGNDCHIGQAVEIKNSIVGHGSSVGHLSYVGDTVIGNKVNFGAGTITSNLRHDGSNHQSMIEGRLQDTGRRKFGAIVGDGVHTGILTAIYPGRKLGPNTSTRPNDTVQSDITAD